MVLADGSCDADVVATDLLSQAEHDKLASAVLVTDSEKLAYDVQASLEKIIPTLSRAEIARASIDNNGRIIIAENLDLAIEVANRIAPEHLEVCVDNPFDYLSKIRNAGSIFMGKNCPEALGDYFAGPNHTLPTSGTARFSSPLSVDDFVKKSQFTYYTEEALSKVCRDVEYFAKREGLTAHAKSVVSRIEEK
jgi:histidinol dehydrogenase